MSKILSYEEKDTWIHQLSGVTKLIFFLLWCVVSMMTYDTRILIFMVLFSLVIFKISKTRWEQVGSVFRVIMVFLIFNVVAIFLFSPDENQNCFEMTISCCMIKSRVKVFYFNRDAHP